VHEISDAVQPKDAEQPRDEQHKRKSPAISRLRNAASRERAGVSCAMNRAASCQTDYGWDCAETPQGPTCRRFANRACQLASSWSRNDHEDGGPTIQLPAAGARCTLRSLSSVQYMRSEAGHPTGSCISREIKAARVPPQWPSSMVQLHVSGRCAARRSQRRLCSRAWRDLRLSRPTWRGHEHDTERCDPAARLGHASAC
jgi:hypothetical protein